MRGFIAQLVKHRTGDAEVTGSNAVEALNFFQASIIIITFNISLALFPVIWTVIVYPWMALVENVFKVACVFRQKP